MNRVLGRDRYRRLRYRMRHRRYFECGFLGFYAMPDDSDVPLADLEEPSLSLRQRAGAELASAWRLGSPAA